MILSYEGLSPELQEKIKACQTPEELIALAQEEGVDLSDEELEKIAGGGRWNFVADCPKCGSHKTGRVSKTEYGCKDCGYKWEAPYNDSAPLMN